MQPKFVYWDKIKELEKELFRRWVCSDKELKEFIITSILIRNNKVLLVGFPGAGKSTLVRLIARGLSKDSSGMIFGMAIGAPEKTLQKVLISTNIVKLLSTGEEEIVVRPIVMARIKFINEINRFSKSIQDALLSLLEEGYLEYGGKIFRTPEYLCFADMNPFRGDMDRALKARFLGSCYIDLPDLSGSKKIIDSLIASEVETQSYPDLVKTMPRVLSIAELLEIWDDVVNVKIPEDVRIFSLMIVSMFRVCKYKRGIIGYMRLKCTECEYSNEPCSFVQEPPDERANLALLLYARARAWLHKRDYVDYSDVTWAAPYILAHRLELKPLVKSRVPNPWVLIKQTIREVIETKWITDGELGVWAESLLLACRALGIKPLESLSSLSNFNAAKLSHMDALRRLESSAYGEFGRGDLVVQQLYEYVKEEVASIMANKRKILEDEYYQIIQGTGITLSQLEDFDKKLESHPRELIRDLIEGIKRKMENFRIAFNLEAILDIAPLKKILLSYDVPVDVVEKVLDKSTNERINYMGKLIRIRRIGKNVIIMAETVDIASEIRKTIARI